MKMKMIKIILLSLCLIGCNEFDFGFYGKQSTTPATVTKRKSTHDDIIPNSNGTVQSCTSDDQCSNEYVCYKQNASIEYVGVCASIK